MSEKQIKAHRKAAVRELESELTYACEHGTYKDILLAAAALHCRDENNPLLLRAKERLEEQEA